MSVIHIRQRRQTTEIACPHCGYKSCEWDCLYKTATITDRFGLLQTGEKLDFIQCLSCKGKITVLFESTK